MAHDHLDRDEPDGDVELTAVLARPVTTCAELSERWAFVLGGGGFAGRGVWLLWFDGDGRQLPLVVPVDDVPDEIDPRLATNTTWIAGQVAADTAGDGASVAIALSRPGPPVVNGADRAWANGLRGAADAQGLRMWDLHLATPGHVRPLPQDEYV